MQSHPCHCLNGLRDGNLHRCYGLSGATEVLLNIALRWPDPHHSNLSLSTISGKQRTPNVQRETRDPCRPGSGATVEPRTLSPNPLPRVPVPTGDRDAFVW